jgi:hypothetical protein
MDLSVKDRKKLWCAASGICSYRHNHEICNKKLFTNEGMSDTNIGDECHIIGEKPGAARYQIDCVDRETYYNAILLCKNHHKIIDDNSDVFTIDILKQMKSEHEQIISKRLADQEITPFILKDTTVSLSVEKAEEAIGLDLQSPTLLSNVNVTLHANDVKRAVGTRISGGFTAQMCCCPNCGKQFGRSYSGQNDLWVKECPFCGHTY